MITEETHQYDPEKIDIFWESVKNGLTDAAKAVLPKKNHENKQKWMTDDILRMMREREENKNDAIKYREWNKKMQKACREAKEQYWKENAKKWKS